MRVLYNNYTACVSTLVTLVLLLVLCTTTSPCYSHRHSVRISNSNLRHILQPARFMSLTKPGGGPTRPQADSEADSEAEDTQIDVPGMCMCMCV
jgi:hypothetical protein